MLIKICGTTSLHDAQLALQFGANALGFIFAPSKRRMAVEQVAAITRSLPSHVERVGVFTVADPKEIAHTVKTAGLSAVQMHWPYDPLLVTGLREALGPEVKLWQVVGVQAKPEDEKDFKSQFIHFLCAAMRDAHLAVVLLDTVKDGSSGGLGEPFSWKDARVTLDNERTETPPTQETCGNRMPRMVLAGGLKAENVREAIAAIRPSGVDVVSGVESSPGIKNAERLRAFIEAVIEAEVSFPPLR